VEPRVSVEGEVQDLGGPVKCYTEDGRLNIVGGDAATESGANDDPNSKKAFVVVIEEGESPVVRYVAIQDAMRMAIMYDHQGSDSNGGNARVFKGGRSYKVSGHGEDKANKEQVVYKSFQIDVTCP
jgi:hypothetical protein